MLITSEHHLTSELAYRRERIIKDWAAANPCPTVRPASRRLRWARLRLPAQRPRTATPA
jgi:hypothetical protein